MKILALDYDGVLVDSKKEAFAVAYNIYQKLYGFKNLNKELLSHKNFNKIDTELREQESEFDRLRPFCSKLYKFSTIIAALDDKIDIKDKKHFLEYGSKLYQDPHFKEKFHNERERLQKENFEEYLKLVPPHKSVIEDVKKLSELFDKVFILTANRKDLIHRVLSKYNLDIPLGNIFDVNFKGRAPKTKTAMIEHLIKEEGAQPKDIVFVEDQLEYARSVIPTGVKLFIVDWGYDNEENRKETRERGIPLLNKENFYSEIKGYIQKAF
ncbi:MAG: HAD family hydrolase [Nanoarchaeota archaeon]|nr:HAD family hydrolase [Nanoarchaeota archaeon]